MSDYLAAASLEATPILTSHRKIRGLVPAAGTDELLARLAAVESRSMQGQMPLVWNRAEGSSIYDDCENQWIDFTSTIFVANVGHANPRVLEHVRNALSQPLVSTYAFPNRYRVEYLEALISFVGAPFDKAFLLSAGTEATDASLKLMRLYAQSKGRGKTVVAVHGNWHGRTMGAQKLSSNSRQSDWIIGRDMAIEHMAFPYPWDATEDSAEEFLSAEITRLEQSLGLDFRTDVCGVMLESFQGWGAFFYPKSYVQALRNFCNDNGVLLAFDEMQAGFGRTGYKFGFEHYGVVPDLFACGKGMGGGFPISGVIGRGEIMDLPATGEMSSTHSANPISCAAGLGVIESLLLDNLIDESRRKGQIMCAQLDEIRASHPDVVRCTSSQGLIGAIVFHEQINDVPGDLLASKICIEAMRRGVLVVRTGRESIKLGPPLVIEDEALVEGLTVLAECLDQAVAHLIS